MMRFSFYNSWLALSLGMSLTAHPGFAGDAAIPVDREVQAAGDLLDPTRPPSDGIVLDPDRALSLSDQGTDLSLLNPRPNDFWGNDVSDLMNAWTPPPETGLQAEFVSSNFTIPTQATSAGWVNSTIRLSSGELRSMSLSTEVHHSLLLRAVLSKMGYSLPSESWVRKITVRFPNQCKLKEFDKLISETQDVSTSRWFVNENYSQLLVVGEGGCDRTTPIEVTLKDVLLGNPQNFLPNLQRGAINGMTIALRQNRAFRALFLPYVLFDVTESLNLFSPVAATLIGGYVHMSHPYAIQFSDTAFSNPDTEKLTGTFISRGDMRWALRKLGPLKIDDWNAFVKAGRYPESLEELLLNKLVARRNQLMQLFGLESEYPALPENLGVSSADVVNGRVVNGEFEDYAISFRLRDKDSPLRFWEVTRYLGMEAIQYAMQRLTGILNEKLQLFTANEVVTKHQNEITEKFKAHFEKYGDDPEHPFALPFGVWGGPVGGLNAQVGRSVVTGSYYGSNSKVQLVDSLGVSANVGVVAGLDGVSTPSLPISVSGVAQLIVSRSYAHVRPIFEMSEAYKANWSDLNVPGFLSALQDYLKDGTETNESNVETRMKKFLGALKQDELMIVTDSISLSPRVGITLPLNPLTGIDLAPIGLSSSISLGVSYPRSVLRRTTIVRTSKGLQVYLQSADTQSLEVGLDFSYFMNILRLSKSHKVGKGRSKVFLIDLSYLDSEDSDNSTPAQGAWKPTELLSLSQALSSLLGSNDSEKLEASLPYYRFRHKKKVDTERFKFLRWQGQSFEEEHLLRVTPPVDAEHRYVASEHERTLYSHVIQSMSGVNDLSFFSDVLNTTLPGQAPNLSSGNDPADTFFGESKTRTVRTEAEITEGATFTPISSVETHWRGMEISKESLFTLFNRLDKRLKSVPGGLSPRTLELAKASRQAFETTRSVQLYDVSTQLLVYPKGAEAIESHLYDPDLKKAVNWVVSLTGVEDLASWCNSMKNALPVGSPIPRDSVVDSYSENGLQFSCLKPWMFDALSFRRADAKSDREKINRRNRLISLMEDSIPFARLLQEFGSDQVYFKLRVGGFRSQDETGYLGEYLSNTIGAFQFDLGQGPFQELISNYQILSHEVEARYLNDGF